MAQREDGGRNGGSGGRSRAHLLAGTALAGLAGIALLSEPVAQAQTAIIVEQVGPNGRDGEHHTFGSNDRATPGGPGPSISRTLSAPLVFPSPAPGRMIRLSSRGGVGGDGDQNVSAADGGAGGAISLTLPGLIASGGQSQAIELVSTGGASGSGAYTSTFNRSSISAPKGGAGGAVQFVLPAGGTIAVTNAPLPPGTTLSVLSASSIGGAGRAGGDIGWFFFNGYPGNGGIGGSGGAVSADISGAIQVGGTGTLGVNLTSRGGNGGTGGTDGGHIVNLPGDGGAGGTGGSVSLTVGSAGSVSTTGDGGAAVILSVLGGHGGNGGGGGEGAANDGSRGGAGGSAGGTPSRPGILFANAGTVSTSGTNAPAVTLQSVGGNGGNGNGAANGGAGGAGGAIAADNSGRITTQGDFGFGIFAQSVGGTGGRGGDATFHGGAGGNAGTGGSVQITNSGSISTRGAGAVGILAQSVGGGNALDAANPADLNLLVHARDSAGGGTGGNATGWFTLANLGGSGGTGGYGGPVTVTAGGDVSTTGSNAPAVWAQSVGGGGAAGGSATQTSLFISIAGGGSGGAGGDGGAVTILPGDRPGRISTTGISSSAIQAFSIGGGGGAGGGVDATTYALGLGISLAIGGAGGNGNVGGNVTVDTASTITTTGADSHGIRAKSIGGGGGTGGQAVSDSVVVGFGIIPAASISAAIGGSGGSGGSGGNVTVTSRGSIATAQIQSHGILASSIGGGGGDGSNAMAKTYTYGTTTQVSVGMSLGGSGGSGGKGGAVTVTNTGTISTGGFAADAIFAQSIGGGGGKGDLGEALSSSELPIPSQVQFYTDMFSGAAYSTTVAVGGKGGSGGTGGAVTVTNSGSIRTAERDARGIFAQSIGGGGGAAASGKSVGGESNQLTVAVGGTGGSGGHGGRVEASNSAGASIVTARDGSHGMHAQSIGGGGGIAGTSTAETGESTLSTVWEKVKENAFKTTVEHFLPNFAKKYGLEPEWTASTSVNLSIGGSGGAAGNGGGVELTNAGTISTAGDIALGMFGQSIGGGGGSGGGATAAGGNLRNASLAVGGSGGASGQGGTVTARNQGTILTAGEAAFGMLSMSIGGGGGSGALGIDDSTMSMDLPVTIGGRQGASGSGGSIESSNAGTIRSTGWEAHGIVSQSIGGGGGTFFVNPAALELAGKVDPASQDPAVLARQQILLDAMKAVGLDPAKLAEDLDKKRDAATASQRLTIGGSPQVTGNGGAVSVTNSGTVTTRGANAFGILAQSIGGGGGLAAGGAPEHRAITTSGSFRGGHGDGGAVTVSLGGGSVINTAGTGAVGILAQSIGGGGGYTGAFAGAEMTHKDFLSGDGAAGNGTGGAVAIRMAPQSDGRATIHTTGRNAHGIFAQSLSGGGGAVGGTNGIVIPAANGTPGRRTGAQGGTSGGVTINLKGTVAATGEDSVAIFAQSGVQRTDGSIDPDSAVRSAGPIQVTFDGDITGGSGTGAGIRLDGGSASVVNFTGGTLKALSGTAIVATGPAATVNSSGRIQGDILFSRPGRLNNLAGGRLEPGGSLNLAGGVLDNRGVLDLAGPGGIGRTTLTGNLSQAKEGRWDVDTDWRNGQADRLTVTGTATIAGTVRPRVVGLPTVLDPTALPAFEFLQAGRLDAGAATAGGSQAVTYRLEAPAAGPARIVVEEVAFNGANAGAGTLSDNEMAAASHLQAVWNGGNLGGLADYMAGVMNIGTPAEYRDALQDLAPESHAVAAANAPQGAARFHNTLHSCPVFIGATARLGEESCTYSRGIWSSMRHGQEGNSSGYNLHDSTYQLGGQVRVGENWFLGASGSYTDRTVVAHDGQSSAQGDAWSAGIVVKRQVGENWLFAGSLGYSYGSLDTARLVSLAGVPLTAAAEQHSHTFSARLRGSYNLDFGQWYLRPGLNLDAVHVRVPGYAESGAGPLNMQYDEASDSQVGVTPQVELGARVDLGDAVLRPYAGLGVTFWSDASWEQTSRLAGAPANAPAIQTSFEGDRVVGQADLGVDLLHAGGIELRAQYSAEIGGDFVSHTGTMRLGIRF